MSFRSSGDIMQKPIDDLNAPSLYNIYNPQLVQSKELIKGSWERANKYQNKFSFSITIGWTFLLFFRI